MKKRIMITLAVVSFLAMTALAGCGPLHHGTTGCETVFTLGGTR